MDKNIRKLFELSAAPTFGICKEDIVFANPAAVKELSCNPEGKSAGSIFPEELFQAGEEQRLCGLAIGDSYYTAAVTHYDDWTLVSLTPEQDLKNEVMHISENIICNAAGPMGNMYLAADRIAEAADGENNEKLQNYIGIWRHNYYSLLRVSENVSLFSALYTGTAVFRPEPEEFTALCGELVDSVNHFAKSMEKRVNFVCEPGQIFVRADKALLERMLLNLLANSLAFTEPGDKITLELQEKPDRVVLAVRDTGCGMPPERLQTAFTWYKQKHDMKTLYSGIGFGLPIAKRIAQLHGGTMILESREQVGTNVVIMLPKERSGQITLATPMSAGKTGERSAAGILTELSGLLSGQDYADRYLD